MCSAWAIIRPLSSKSAVEQSRRSLMFAENAERTSAAPISSQTARSAAPITCSSIFTLLAPFRHTLVSTKAATMARPIPNPHPPGGDPAAGAVQFDHGRAGHVEWVRRRELQLGPAAHLGGSDGDQLERAVAVGVAVPLLVGRVEALGEPLAERHRQLERLAAVAEVRLALAGQLTCLCERSQDGAHRVAPLVGDREAERREDTRRLRHEDRPDPELLRQRARVQRAGAAEGHEGAVAGVAAPFDRNDAKRPQHLGVDGADDLARVEVPERGRAASPSSSRPPASLSGSRSSSRFASVTVGKVPPSP